MVSTNCPLLLSILCALVALITAQDFTVPEGWRNTTSVLTQEQRIQLAYAADTILSTAPYTPPTNLLPNGLIDSMNLDVNKLLGLRAISHTDFITGNATFGFVIMDQLTSVVESVLNPAFGIRTYTPDVLISGLLAMDVYFAYNNSAALTMAQSLWNLAYSSQVQPDQATLGNLSSLDISFSSACNDESVAGAVFGLCNNGGEPGIFGINFIITQITAANVGGFLALSSYLYKATRNETYLSSAELATQFIQNHLTSDEVPLHDIDIDPCVTSLSDTGPGDAGFVLEGLATLSALNNGSYDDLMRTLISTMIPFSSWTGSDGVFLADAHASNLTGIHLTAPEYIRGLHEAQGTMDPQDPAALFIQSFLMLQYNALLNLASFHDMYALDWHGPPPNQTDSVAQTAALDVLNSAITVGLPNTTSITNNSSSSSSSSTTQPLSSGTSGSASPPSSHPIKSIGPIIGGCVGGATVVLLFVVLVLWRRRKAKIDEQSFIRAVMETTTVPHTEIHPRPYMNAAHRKLLFRHGPSPYGPPITSMPGGLSASDMRGADRDAAESAPSGPAQPHHEPAQLAPQVETISIVETDDSEAVPDIVNRLNRIMARLPPGGIIMEEPPAYHNA